MNFNNYILFVSLTLVSYFFYKNRELNIQVEKYKQIIEIKNNYITLLGKLYEILAESLIYLNDGMEEYNLCFVFNEFLNKSLKDISNNQLYFEDKENLIKQVSLLKFYIKEFKDRLEQEKIQQEKNEIMKDAALGVADIALSFIPGSGLFKAGAKAIGIGSKGIKTINQSIKTISRIREMYQQYEKISEITGNFRKILN